VVRAVAAVDDVQMTFKQWDIALDTGGNMTDYGAGFRPTYYLMCTQLGQFEVRHSRSTIFIPQSRSVLVRACVCRELEVLM
jgi:hypothetical protein